MSAEPLTISLGSAVYGMHDDGRVFSSFVCGFSFLETRAFVIVPRRFCDTVASALFSAPSFAYASALSCTVADSLQRLIDVGLEHTVFAAIPLADTVLIDEEQDHAREIADLGVGDEVDVEGVDEIGFYVCALQTRLRGDQGDLIYCDAVLSKYELEGMRVDADLMGRRVLRDGVSVGVVVAINVDKRLVFLSRVQPVLKRSHEILGDDGEDYPKRIDAWNTNVRRGADGSHIDDPDEVTDKIIETVKGLLTEPRFINPGNWDFDTLVSLRDAYRKDAPVTLPLEKEVVNG